MPVALPRACRARRWVPSLLPAVAVALLTGTCRPGPLDDPYRPGVVVDAVEVTRSPVPISGRLAQGSRTPAVEESACGGTAPTLAAGGSVGKPATTDERVTLHIGHAGNGLAGTRHLAPATCHRRPNSEP